jgi:uncharacterized protein
VGLRGMTTVEVGPVRRADRIGSLDVLRGVAVCGILLMNIPIMGLIGEVGRPRYPVAVDLDWIAYSVQSLVFEGSMRGLFTLLFGAGMLIRLRPRDSGAGARATQAYFTRCFALILLGVFNFAILMWPGEILTNYGIVGLGLYLFRKADLRLLVTAAAAVLIVMTMALAMPSLERGQQVRDGIAAAEAKAAGKTLTDDQKEALEARTKMLGFLHPRPADVARETAQRTSFPGVLAWSANMWTEFNLSAQSGWFLCETLAFMLLGLVLFRTGVLAGEKSLGFYAAMAAGGYALGFLVRGGLLALQWRAGFEPTPLGGIYYNFTYELGRLPTTLGLTGLILLLFKAGALNGIKGVLSAIGRLALTNYIGQSLITSVLFYGFALVGRFDFAALMGIAALIWVAQGTFSVLWLKRYEMGPFEWLLRALTYGALKPLQRAAT